MKYIVNLIRLALGVLFIFSGIIKMNDPMGFAFKLEEYFAEGVLNVPFFIPVALPFAIAIVIVEVLLGVWILIGHWQKLTLWGLTLMMVFFDFLTFYSAYFDKVTDCGCFGDAIPLTPWESFGKDVMLSVMIAILWLGRKHMKPLMPGKGSMLLITSLVVALSATFSSHVLHHLPVWDFRAYKPGTNVIEGMASAEELGLQGPVYESYFVLVNSDGNRVEVSGTDYIDEKWYEKTEWQIVEDLTYSLKIADGYEPPIHDFVIQLDGWDVTDSILALDQVNWLISFDMKQANSDALVAMVRHAAEERAEGKHWVFMTSNNEEDIAALFDEAGATLPASIMDGTALKTVVRSNPGVTEVDNAVIQRHWSHQDFLNSL